MIIYPISISIILIIISSPFYLYSYVTSNILDSFDTQIKKELKELGYNDATARNPSSPSWDNHKFSCLRTYNDFFTVTGHFEAVKSNTLRRITVCLNRKGDFKVYDAREVPKLPLMVNIETAKKVYMQANNTQALELLK